MISNNSEKYYPQNKRFSPSNPEPSSSNLVAPGVNSNNNPISPQPLPQTPIQSQKAHNIPFNQTQTNLVASNIPGTSNPQTSQLLASSGLKNSTIVN
jgi:hypothetical protein